MFLILLVIVGFICAMQMEWKRVKWLHLTKDVKIIKSLCLPCVGSIGLFMGNDKKRMSGLKHVGRESIRLGGLCKIYFGSDLYYSTVDPDVAEIALKNCLNKGKLYGFLKLFLGKGLITAPSLIWRPRRKLVAKAFNVKNLQSFVSVISSQSIQLSNKLKEDASVDPIKLWPYLSAYTIDTVCESILGVKFDTQNTANHPFLVALLEIISLISQRMLQPWLHFDFIYKLLPSWKRVLEHQSTVYGFIDENIKSKRELQMNNHKDEGDLTGKVKLKTIIEILIEHEKDGTQISNEEIREEIVNIVWAGTDTSAAGTGFTLSMLARYPEIQQKVYAEQCEIFGDSDRPVEAADLPKMKYLEDVIKETLRLFPPIPAILRSIDKDVKLPSTQVLHKGTQLVLHIWAMHRNPRYWGADAEMFRPERFQSPIPHNAFMPFSTGARNCVGYQFALLSMKTATATLIRNFNFLPTEISSDPDCDDISSKFLLIMKDASEYNLIVRSRSEKCTISN